MPKNKHNQSKAEWFQPRNITTSHQLIAVALGKEPADLVITNASLLNVYTGELQHQQIVGIKGQWIAYVGTDHPGMIGTSTHVIDAEGMPLIPGFIDAHTHLAWLFTPAEFLRYAMSGGTTTIVTETLEPYPVSGYEGVVDFLESLADQPVKILSTIPPMVSISQAVEEISMADLDRLLARPDIIGLGESYWQGVLKEPNRFLPIFRKTLLAGKAIEGHSAGARDQKLNAYLTTGVSSCHEPINAEQVLERLRLGLHVMIREGSIRRDLEKIAKVTQSEADFRRLVLVTDGVTPDDLKNYGYMEYLVQKAIDVGFDPIDAIRMATLNPAEHFGLDGWIGGIAPGRYADIVIVPSIRSIRPEYVISNGRVVAHRGALRMSPRAHAFSKASRTSIHLNRKLTRTDFELQVPTEESRVSVRVIDMVTDLVTAEVTKQMPVIEGYLRADINRDLLKIAAIDRTHKPGQAFVGLLHGFGLCAGAVASSAAWDTTDILVIGVHGTDMAAAVNRIRTLQGGIVFCKNGKIEAELPLSVFGLLSELSLEEIIRHTQAMRELLLQHGVHLPDPILSLNTLSGAAIPFLRICEQGLVHLKSGETLGILAGDEE